MDRHRHECYFTYGLYPLGLGLGPEGRRVGHMKFLLFRMDIFRIFFSR